MYLISKAAAERGETGRLGVALLIESAGSECIKSAQVTLA